MCPARRISWHVQPSFAAGPIMHCCAAVWCERDLGRSASPAVLHVRLQLLHQRNREREGLPGAGPGLADQILPIIHGVEGLHLDVEQV